MSKYMYRVTFSERFSIVAPRIRRQEVVKKTAKTVVYKHHYVQPQWNGKTHDNVEKVQDRREAFESDGVRWFDTFDEAKKWTMEFMDKQISEAEDRLNRFKDHRAAIESLNQEGVDAGDE